jgi:hypothetical protein
MLLEIFEGSRMRKRLRDGQVAIWAVELVYPHPPQRRGSVARGSGKMVLQPDGTVCIDGSHVRVTDEWGRPFYLRLNMRIYEGVDEIVEKDPHLIGAIAG